MSETKEISLTESINGIVPAVDAGVKLKAAFDKRVHDIVHTNVGCFLVNPHGSEYISLRDNLTNEDYAVNVFPINCGCK